MCTRRAVALLRHCQTSSFFIFVIESSPALLNHEDTVLTEHSLPSTAAEPGVDSISGEGLGSPIADRSGLLEAAAEINEMCVCGCAEAPVLAELQLLDSGVLHNLHSPHSTLTQPFCQSGFGGRRGVCVGGPPFSLFEFLLRLCLSHFCFPISFLSVLPFCLVVFFLPLYHFLPVCLFL